MMNRKIEQQKQQIRIVPGKDAAGQAIFSVLLKRSYQIKNQQIAQRLVEVDDLQQTDEYYKPADPRYSTVKFESDLVPYKLKTDVVFIGNAYTADGQPQQSLMVGIEVAEKKKLIQVIGDRHCHYQPHNMPLITEPQLFTQMPMRYEYAYGGVDLVSIPELEFHYPRNPMGKGFVLKNTAETIEGLPLPNLEDPQDLLTAERIIIEEPIHWNQQPLPQGLGWLQRNWYPRASFAGAMPSFVDINQPMREEALGLVPTGQIKLARQLKLPSHDQRFYTGASYGLSFPYLNGDETIRLANLCKESRIFSFQLPNDKPQMMLDIGLGNNQLDVVLHTVCIRMEDKEIDLVWRGAHVYPGVDWLPEMTRQVVEVN